MSIKFRTVKHGSQAINNYFRSYSFVVPKHCINVCASSRIKLNTFSKRDLHSSTSSTRRFLPIISALGGQSITLAVPHSFISRNQACGLHTTCQRVAALSSSGSDVAADEYFSENLTSVENISNLADGNVIASESQNTAVSVTELATNNAIHLPSSFDSSSVQDIFASGAGETLSSLGLGGYTPIGVIQHMLDFGHVSLGLPWWGSIVCCTILFRLVVFPLMVKGHINSAKMNALAPEMERLQTKMRDVHNLQNPVASAAVTAEMQELYRKHNINPAKMLIAPLVQMPLFVSFFIGLRRMVELPIESMKTGGLLWFPDLTVADPFYVLPVLCAGTMLLMVEMGDTGMQSDKAKKMKYFMRGMCGIMLIVTYSFPTAIFTYWSTSNLFAIGQIHLLKQSWVKEKLGIPLRVDHPPNPTPNPDVKEGSWLENARAGYKNALQAGRLAQQQKIEESIKNTKIQDENNPRLKQNEELFRKGRRKK